MQMTYQQILLAIATLGNRITYLVLGEPGTAKSSMLKALAKLKPASTPVYLDAPMLDVGDLVMSIPEQGSDFLVRKVAKLMGDPTKPLIILIDEFAKAPAYIAPILNTLLLERRIGDVMLHPDTIVFATSNNASDQVGDTLKFHTGNRVTIVDLAKMTATEWQPWAINNGIHPTVLSWVASTPTLFESYKTAAKHPDGTCKNGSIFDPRKPGVLSFVTHRSVEKASYIFANKDLFGEESTMAQLVGTIGEAAARSLMAYDKVTCHVPKVSDVIANPMGLAVPDNVAVQLTFLYYATSSNSRDVQTAADLSAVMQYIERFGSRELCGVFYAMVSSAEHLTSAFRNCAAIKTWGGKNVALLNV